MTIGLHEDLNQAAKMATKEMLDFVVATKGLSRDDAYMLLSAAMDLHISENVDITKGVHAMLAKSIFKR
jgi:acetamidase/formamidase